MTESSLFWDTNGTGDGLGTGYTSSQMFELFRALLSSSGVNLGGVKGEYLNELAVTGTSSPVQVATGAALVYGIPYFNSSPVAVNIPTPSSGTRIDRIVLRATWATQTVRVARVAGTEGGGLPALTTTAGTVWELPLAQVSITTGGVITVTDERPWLDVTGDGKVTTAKLADGAVTAAKLATDAVETAKIKDANVTAAKLAADAVETAKIKDGAVTSAKLATGAVTATKLGDGAVATAKLDDGAVTDAKLANSAVTADKLASNAVTTAKIADGNVTAAKLASNAVTTNAMANGAVTGAKIAAWAIDARTHINGTQGIIASPQTGNARGSGAVDLQTAELNDHVAAGEWSTIAGGRLNRVGSLATFAFISGGYFGFARRYGQYAHAAGPFATAGDAQHARYILRRITTNATQTELLLDNNVERLVIENDTTIAFTALIVARRTDADNESAAYEIKGCIDNNANTVALVGTITKTVIAEDTAAWDITAEADNTNKALVFKATGQAGKTIRWVATVFATEVTG